jgi:hypothetical protein
MVVGNDDGTDEEWSGRADDFARRERELAQVRANIERLRRERQARLAEFTALTHRKEECLPPAPTREPAPGESSAASHPTPVAPPPEPETPSQACEHHDDRFAEPAAPPGEVAFTGTHAGVDAAAADARLPEEARAASVAARRWTPGRVVTYALACAVVLAAMALAWWALPGRGPVPTTPAAPASPGARVEPVSETPSPTPATPATAAGAALPAGGPAGAPAAARHLVVQLVAARAVWIRGVADGRVTLNRTVPAGETLTLEADASVTLRLGDAGAVRVIVNGRDRGPAGRDGQVLTVSVEDQ